MPRSARDEEARIAMLQSIPVEDLANKRITDNSSERERELIHQAREQVREKNDERYKKRYIEKSKIDLERAQINRMNQRKEHEIYGQKGLAGEGGILNETAGLFGLSGKSASQLALGAGGLAAVIGLRRAGALPGIAHAASAAVKPLSATAQKTQKLREKTAYISALRKKKAAERLMKKESKLAKKKKPGKGDSNPNHPATQESSRTESTSPADKGNGNPNTNTNTPQPEQAKPANSNPPKTHQQPDTPYKERKTKVDELKKIKKEIDAENDLKKKRQSNQP